MASIHVDIVSAEGEIFAGEAEMVFAPAKMGEVGIAPRHAPLLTDLKPGEVRVQTADGDEKFFYVTGGILTDAEILDETFLDDYDDLETTDILDENFSFDQSDY